MMKLNQVATTARSETTTAIRGAISAGQVDRMLGSLVALQKTPLSTETEARETLATILSLTKPAPRDWVQGEVAKLMVHYFVGDLPDNFAKSFGDDWDAELATYPAWAILKARRWWLSRENKKWKHRKPVPGELSEVAHKAMGPVIYARSCVDRWERAQRPKRAPDNQEVTQARPDADQLAQRKREAAAIMSGFGGFPK